MQIIVSEGGTNFIVSEGGISLGSESATGGDNVAIIFARSLLVLSDWSVITPRTGNILTLQGSTSPFLVEGTTESTIVTESPTNLTLEGGTLLNLEGGTSTVLLEGVFTFTLEDGSETILTLENGTTPLDFESVGGGTLTAVDLVTRAPGFSYPVFDYGAPRMTQQYAEVLYGRDPGVRVTQQYVEVLTRQTAAQRTTQQYAEVLYVYSASVTVAPATRLSTVSGEVVVTPSPMTRLSQQLAEALVVPSPVTRISANFAEVVTTFAVPLRLSSLYAEVVCKHSLIDNNDLVVGSPELGRPILDLVKVNLTATGLTTGSPVIGSTAITVRSVFAAVNLTTGSPDIGTPAFGLRTDALTVLGLTTGSPEIGSPEFNNFYVPSAQRVEKMFIEAVHVTSSGKTGVRVEKLTLEAVAQPTLPTPLARVEKLGIEALTSDPALVPVSSTRVEKLWLEVVAAYSDDTVGAINLVTGSAELGRPILRQTHRLTALSLTTGRPALGTPLLRFVRVLAASNLTTGSPVLGSPVLGMIHVLRASNLVTASPVLGPAYVFMIDFSILCLYAEFVPVWLTPATLLGTYTENDAIRIPLQVDNIATSMAVEGQTSFTVGAMSPFVNRFVVSGVDTPYTISGMDMVFDPLPANAVFEVYTSDFFLFTVLNESLPPGLILHPSTGEISGTITNVVDATTFEFTIRVTNGCRVRDRTFTMDVLPLNYATILDVTNLPALTQEPTLGIEYRYLGAFVRGDSVNVTLSLSDADGILPPLSIEPVDALPYSDTLLPGLPSGVALSGLQIEGVVGAQASMGEYWFALNVQDDVAPMRYIFRLDVMEGVAATVQPIRHIEWVTPAGLLGQLNEGDQSFFTLEAKVVAGPDATYELIGNSSLPPGLQLDAATGYIIGSAAQVPATATYGFTVRARSENVFVDRAFSILVNRVYTSVQTVGSLAPTVMELWYKLRVVDEDPFVAGYKEWFAPTALYRSADPEFGVPQNPRVYIIKGLDGTADLTRALVGEGGSVITNPDYHTPKKYVLGKHKSAVVRGINGAVVYEVVYRELLDPMARAGGFVTDSNMPVDLPVLYPQDKSKTIYPASIHNIRYDLVQDIGFAVADPARKYILGVDGPESLPPWMRAEQVAGSASSALGFVPALVVAHVKPGTAEGFAAKLNTLPQFAPGKVFTFDKYYYIDRGGSKHYQLR